MIKKLAVAGNTISFRYVHAKPLNKAKLAELLVKLGDRLTDHT